MHIKSSFQILRVSYKHPQGECPSCSLRVKVLRLSEQTGLVSSQGLLFPHPWLVYFVIFLSVFQLYKMMGFVMTFYTLYKCTFIIFSLIVTFSYPLSPLFFLLPSYPPLFSCLFFFFSVNFYPFLSFYFLLSTLTQYDEEI